MLLLAAINLSCYLIVFHSAERFYGVGRNVFSESRSKIVESVVKAVLNGIFMSRVKGQQMSGSACNYRNVADFEHRPTTPTKY